MSDGSTRTEALASLAASARKLIEGLDSEAYISAETCELINQFDRLLEATFPNISASCETECQNAKDVGMREYSCASRCQYLDAPRTPPREVGIPISPEEAERRRQMVAKLRAQGVIGRTMQ